MTIAGLSAVVLTGKSTLEVIIFFLSRIVRSKIEKIG